VKTAYRRLHIVVGVALAAIVLTGSSGLDAQTVILVHPWNPVVGKGAVYQSVNGPQNLEIELSTIGKQEVNGTDAYWIEFWTLETKTVEKYLLMLVDGDHGKRTQMMRMIRQRGDDHSVETGPESPAPNLDEIATPAGTEDVTTPAGTFHCEHYRAKNGKWEAWFSPDVTPFGLVKTTNTEGTEMIVVGRISDAKDRITSGSNER